MASGGSGSSPGSAAPTSPSAPHTAHHHGDTTTTISVRDSCELLRKLAAEMIVGGADAIASDDLSKRIVSIAVELILNQAGQSSAAGEHASRRRAPLLARSDDIAAVGKEDESRVRRQRAAAAARVRRLLDQSLRTPATDDGRLTCQVWEWAGYCQAVLAHRARRRLFVFFLIFF